MVLLYFFNRRKNMCQYANISQGRCKVDNEFCPYLYFCTKINGYKESQNMPAECKKIKKNLPRNCYEVSFEKRDKLYVNVKNNIVIVDNPFDHIPVYVKMFRNRNGKWTIKEEIH